MPSDWPALPYETWRATCDTLHAHAQVLGKLAVVLAPPEPQLQHAALRLSARGWETLPLPAPDRSGAFVVALDLHSHQAVVEHSDGRARRVPLTPNRPVGEVTREVLAAVGELVGPVRIDLRPQETPWTTPLDEDDDHHTYEPAHVAAYFSAATQAALVLAALRAPYRGRSTPVNAWWGTFDLAVSLFSGRPADPPSDDFITRNSANAQQIEVGWWPGDARYPRPAFFAFAFPGPGGVRDGDAVTTGRPLGQRAGRVHPRLGRRPGRAGSRTQAALEFGRSAVRQACMTGDWDPFLAGSAAESLHQSPDRRFRPRDAVADHLRKRILLTASNLNDVESVRAIVCDRAWGSWRPGDTV